jgi:hypothetical protein
MKSKVSPEQKSYDDKNTSTNNADVGVDFDDGIYEGVECRTPNVEKVRKSESPKKFDSFSDKVSDKFSDKATQTGENVVKLFFSFVTCVPGK